MAKNIIGIINPKDEIPKEYIKLLLKNKIQYEIFRDGKNFSKYSGFLVVGNKNFNENEINLDIFSSNLLTLLTIICSLSYSLWFPDFINFDKIFKGFSI